MKKVLDLYCKAGGAAMGYSRAGFEVVGVDINPQPNYPFPFVQADALKVLGGAIMWYPTYRGERVKEALTLEGFDAIHASPPCQRYSSLSAGREGQYPDLYGATRDALSATGKPWIIENVMGAPYDSGIVLCGSMFDLVVRRHRNFETSWLILNGLHCDHKKQGRPITVTGYLSDSMINHWDETKHSLKGYRREWPQYMGMEWATPQEATQAIPPAYTEYIGERLMEYLVAARKES